MEVYEEQTRTDMEDGDSSEKLLLSSGCKKTEGLSLSSSVSWDLAFYGDECFSAEVVQYAADLAQHSEAPCLDDKAQELQQQLTIETRNLKKTRNFYKKLIQQERKKNGSDNTLMLSKLRSQLEELKSKVLFLIRVKKYLQTLSVDQWGVDLSLIPSLAVNRRVSEDYQPSLISFSVSKGKNILQSGTPLDLMSYLYTRRAVLQGYIHQFLYTYRFFCTAEDLLHFITEIFINAAREVPDMSSDSEKIFHRSLDLLHIWIKLCRSVDFSPESSLVQVLEHFLRTEVVPVHSQGEVLLAVLNSSAQRSFHNFDEDNESLSLSTSTEDLGQGCHGYGPRAGSGPFWSISGVGGSSGSLSSYSISAALPKPGFGSLVDDVSHDQIPFSHSEYSSQQVAQQLTLLQQEMFLGCHPVHFLNSRTQGLKPDTYSTEIKNLSQCVPILESSSEGPLHHLLDSSEGPLQHLLDSSEGPIQHLLDSSEGPIHQLLSHADRVSHWISREIVICDSVKSQAVVLTKYLMIGKMCSEWRDFATAMMVLRALQNETVKQLPAWKHVSSKVCDVLEELEAVEVFLKNDDLCLMRGGHNKPTLPAAHILALHLQQLEIGAFTLTTGAYKWSKLRTIAKVVSQVHAFQQFSYSYRPIRELQNYLHHRIIRTSSVTSDLRSLSSENISSVQQQSNQRQTRRIQETLKRVKKTFQ